MLVLSRKVGERIRIADDIEVVVLEVSRDQVRIGVQAPRHVTVHRHEVYCEIVEANRAAAVADVGADHALGAAVSRTPPSRPPSAVNPPRSPVTAAESR
ncbi:MAG: carbon storage regulator CsrA [Ilumatobacteraceae bacterium]